MLLEMDEEQRLDILSSYRELTHVLVDTINEKIMAALRACDQNNFNEALKIRDEAILSYGILTDLKSSLTLQYKKCVSLH